MDVDTLAAPSRHRSRFVLEFDTWAEFKEFIAICRFAPGDDAEVAELANKVRVERQALAAKVAQTTPVT